MAGYAIPPGAEIPPEVAARIQSQPRSSLELQSLDGVWAPLQPSNAPSVHPMTNGLPRPPQPPPQAQASQNSSAHPEPPSSARAASGSIQLTEFSSSRPTLDPLELALMESDESDGDVPTAAAPSTFGAGMTGANATPKTPPTIMQPPVAMLSPLPPRARRRS